jgi:hypothetical protein
LTSESPCGSLNAARLGLSSKSFESDDSSDESLSRSGASWQGSIESSGGDCRRTGPGECGAAAGMKTLGEWLWLGSSGGGFGSSSDSSESGTYPRVLHRAGHMVEMDRRKVDEDRWLARLDQDDAPRRAATPVKARKHVTAQRHVMGAPTRPDNQSK